MKFYLFMSAVMWCAMQAHAAEEPFVLDAKQIPLHEKRFLPLNQPKATDASQILGTEKKFYPLRSDRNQLQQGGMRSDRERASPIAAQQSASPADKKAETPRAGTVQILSPEKRDYELESEEIAGLNESIDPVLALFDSEQGAGLTSFADAMRGNTPALSASGLMRHLIWPIPLSEEQHISSVYGVRKDPFHGRPTFHGGVDIAAATGTAVPATADGNVIDAKTDANYGRYVTLEHSDGTLTRYGHLSAQHVREGQRVRAGQRIGAVGSTGRSTGAHLDYRVSKNGVKYDPLSILSVPLAVATNERAPSFARDSIVHSPPKIASNALPRGPMVIKVR